MVNALIAIGAALLAAIAEAIHARRIARVRYLAFGRAGGPRGWTSAAGAARSIGVGALCWALLTLWSLDGGVRRSGEGEAGAPQRLVVCLDVSPSMYLEDAGSHKDRRRGERAGALVRSVLERLDMERTRVSVVAFYTDAKPVVVDTFDLNVVLNVLNDLPLEHAFEHGDTDMYAGIERAFELAAPWDAESAALIVVSDGDTLPDATVPRKPRSISDVLVIGVGDPFRGSMIAGRASRQDVPELRRLALRLGGEFHDGNERHLPSATLAGMSLRAPPSERDVPLRGLALAAAGIGGGLIGLTTPALALLGAPAGRRRANNAMVGSGAGGSAGARGATA